MHEYKKINHPLSDFVSTNIDYYDGNDFNFVFSFYSFNPFYHFNNEDESVMIDKTISLFLYLKENKMDLLFDASNNTTYNIDKCLKLLNERDHDKLDLLYEMHVKLLATDHNIKTINDYISRVKEAMSNVDAEHTLIITAENENLVIRSVNFDLYYFGNKETVDNFEKLSTYIKNKEDLINQELKKHEIAVKVSAKDFLSSIYEISISLYSGENEFLRPRNKLKYTDATQILLNEVLEKYLFNDLNFIQDKIRITTNDNNELCFGTRTFKIGVTKNKIIFNN